MKIHLNLFAIIILMLTITGCAGRGSVKKAGTEADTITVPDTGYTGIKQYMSGQYMVKEVTFKNGVRHGLMKTFLQTGELYQAFWYENGMREDSSIWYYQQGQVFRTTPYRHDTIDGIQIQYYRTGKVKAKIGFNKGLRTPYLEEFTSDGKLVREYPEIIVTTSDEYASRGLYRINLELSDKSKKVKFYRGEFTDNRFDTTLCKSIAIVNGKGRLDLKKSGTPGQNYVGVIAAILTDFGNRYLTYRKIDLPYNDLK